MEQEGGNYIEIAGGAIQKFIEQDHTSIAGGSIERAAPEGCVIETAERGIVFGAFIKEEENNTETTEVKEIELDITSCSPLGDGSTNDKKGKYQKGLVYSNNYCFKIKTYTEGKPKDIFSIKWKVKYHSIKQNKWVEQPLFSIGEISTLQFLDTDLCGRYVYIKAYINDTSVCKELKLWAHNRFRFFDRKIVYEQAEARAKEPWRINQGTSSLCGMACIFYLLAKKDAKGYEKLAKELFRTGEYIYNGHTIKPHEKALDMYDMKPHSSNCPEMPEVDWIVLATTRSKESLDRLIYRGIENGDMDMLKAVNWPKMMNRMSKELVGYDNAESIGLSLFLIQQKKRPIGGKLYDYTSDSDLEHLQNIETAYQKGHKIMMMIDAQMLEDITSYDYEDAVHESHWVVYEGGLQLLDENKNPTTVLDDVEFVSFRMYTWGYDPVKGVDEENKFPRPKYKLLINNRIISAKSFKSTFYGYIENY